MRRTVAKLLKKKTSNALEYTAAKDAWKSLPWNERHEWSKALRASPNSATISVVGGPEIPTFYDRGYWTRKSGKKSRVSAARAAVQSVKRMVQDSKALSFFPSLLASLGLGRRKNRGDR